MNCPHCGAGVEGISASGPGEHCLDPCGCPATATARHLASAGEDVERGRGVAADGGVRFTDLHAFQRDLLYAVRALERDGDAPKGLAVKRRLEAEYDEELNHSRLYQNLDALVQKGLVAKGKKDDRTNEYATTDAGRGMLDRVTERHADAVGLDAEPDADAPGEREVATDGGEEQYGAATRFAATNADTETILLGRHDEPTTLSVPEVHDGTVVRARRYYEPVTVVSFPYSMSEEDAIDWLDDHRHHPDLADYDWKTHEARDLLDVIVDNRNRYRMQLSDFERQLESVRAVGERTKRELKELREAMTDAMENGPPVEVNCLAAPDEEVDA